MVNETICTFDGERLVRVLAAPNWALHHALPASRRNCSSIFAMMTSAHAGVVSDIWSLSALLN